MKKVILSFAVMTAFVAVSNAQTNPSATATQHVTMNVSDAIELTFIGANAGQPATMAFATTDDFANGVKSDEVRMKVRSNRPFLVDVKTGSSMMQLNGSSSTMPVSKMAITVSSNSTGGTPITGAMPLSSTSQPIITGGQNGGNQTFGVKYTATPGFEYPAGAYSTDVVYTATQQ